MSNSRALLLLCAGLAVACKSDPAPAPEPNQAAQTATATATVATAATAAPSAPVTASAAATAEPARWHVSKRPTPLEWCTSANRGHLEHGCMYSNVREHWLVTCPSGLPGGKVEPPLDLKSMDPGAGRKATEAEAGALDSEQAAVMTFDRAGLVFEPTFHYGEIGKTGTTEYRSIKLRLPASATSAAAVELPPGSALGMDGPPTPARIAWCEQHFGAAAARDAGPPTPVTDIPDLGDPPAEEAWAAVREVTTKGSSALGCETKVLDRWFRMRCAGKATITAFEPTRGKRPTQTRITVAPERLELHTPYVEDTDFAAEVTTDQGKRRFTLSWPKGTPRPIEVARFE